MNHRTRRSVRSFRYLVPLLALLAWQARPATRESVDGGGRVISFPAPPDPEAIGTQFGAIDTHVSQVTLPPPASIHRLGLVYSEIRGTIKGIGWGGSTAALLKCPYEYELPYVLRIPPGWDGGLVIFRHQFERADLVAPWEEAYGDRNFYRVIHEEADRSISDVALHPNRRWAFFAVNQTGVAPGGAFNTRLLEAPGCTAGTPVTSLRDTSIARDHALLAQRLLKLLRDRDTTLTLGVGFTQGAVVNLGLNAGHRYPGDSTKAGDNHRTPYDLSSGHIFDGFLWIDGAPATGVNETIAAPSVPTIFLLGEATAVNQQAPINQISRLVTSMGLHNVEPFVRVYSVRNLPLIDADMNLSLTREDIDWADATLPSQPSAPREYYLGSGERIRPVTGALLDALAEWTKGVPPVASRFNGDAIQSGSTLVRIDFQRTGPTTTVSSFPYGDDQTQGQDTFDGLNATATTGTQATQLRAAWSTARTELAIRAASIVLPETACRRGTFHFTPGLAGTDFHQYDESSFLTRWPDASAQQLCRTTTVDALVSGGLYDPTFVSVDVDPTRTPNVVDLQSSERLAVAIFSTNGFDATDIVPGSLRLAGASLRGEAPNPGGVDAQTVDLDGDGRLDLLVKFRRDRLYFTALDVVADVWGQTRGGVAFTGSDVIQLVGAP